MKGPRWKSIDRKIDILINADRADIRFSDVRIDLHFSQVVRNLENDGRLQTGRDGLADIDVARNHYPIDRRGDRAMVEIGFRFIERALLNLHIAFSLMKCRHRRINILLG